MKKLPLIISFFSLAVLLGVSSCGDKEPGQASKEEVRAAFMNANTRISNDLNSANATVGIEAMNQLAELTEQSDPFSRKATGKREQVIDNFKAGLYAVRGILTHASGNARIQGDQPFEYNSNKGIYEWSSTQQEFLPAGTSNIVEIRFPSAGADSPTNDAVFQLTAYAEQETPEGEQAYSPTLIKASIAVKGTKELELNADAQYDDWDQPVKGNVYYFFNPFAFEVSFDNSKPKSSSFSETLSKSGTVLIAFGATVDFNTADKIENDISSANAFVQLLDLKFVITTNPSATNANDALKIDIWLNNKMGGKIIFEQDTNTGNLIPYVQYNDGSTELLEDLLTDIGNELDNILG